MTSLIDIKPRIRDFVATALGADFKAVYWQSERLDEPVKPYCMLTELADSQTDRTAWYKSGAMAYTLEEYKQVVITVGVYVDGLDEFDVRKEFAYSSLNNLKSQIEIGAREFVFGDIAIKSLSGIRPLNEEVDGGYLFRYEFDITIGYNEETIADVEIGKEVDLELKDENDIIIIDEVISEE